MPLSTARSPVLPRWAAAALADRLIPAEVFTESHQPLNALRTSAPLSKSSRIDHGVTGIWQEIAV